MTDKLSPQEKGGLARAQSLSHSKRRQIASDAAKTRWVGESSLPKVDFPGLLKLGEMAIPCAVLSDGRRVLTESGIANAILGGRSGASIRAKRAAQGSGAPLPVFIAPERLKPFINKELEGEPFAPIQFKDGRRVSIGYDPRVLRAVCEVWLRARAAGALLKSQIDKAQKAELLMRSLADVGIVALVDEATGYQQFRARDELQKILAAYIAPDLLPWSQRFPQNFYAELHRVRGWPYKEGSNKRNHYIGKLTNELIYKQLPQGVLDELKRKNPTIPMIKRRKHLHYRFLTEEVGDPHLQKQIISVTTLLSVADDWDEFTRLFCKKFPPGPGDLFALPPPSEK